jgi:hypothetical protein
MSQATRRARRDAERAARKKRARPKMPVVRATVLCFWLMLIAGCGSATKTTTVTPTKAQYIVSADAICLGLAQENKGFAAEENAGKLSAEYHLSKAKKAAEEANASLHTLAEPSADTSTITKWLHLRERATANSGSGGNFKEVVAATAKASSIAKAYGLRSCAELPATRTTTGPATTNAAATAQSGPTPQLVCIDSKGYEVPETKPATCLIRPPDGSTSESVSLADLHWSSWGPTSATATGESLSLHPGQVGSPGPTPVRLVASQVGRDATTGGLIFTQVTDYSANTPNGYTVRWVAPEKPRASETSMKCANGVVVTEATCAFAAQVGAAYIKEEGNHDSSLELTVHGQDVTCTLDTSADGHFGDVTCTDKAGASVEFAIDATESGGSVPGPPTNRAPESSTQQALCNRLYREYQEGGEGSAAAIQEYGKDGCQ